MTRPYLFLISALALLALGVGLLAYSRSAEKPRPQPMIPQSTPVIIPTPTPEKLPLEVSVPDAGTTSAVSRFVLSGKTAPFASVSANEKTLTASSSGDFKFNLTLSLGENDIDIVASDSSRGAHWSGGVTYTPKK